MIHDSTQIPALGHVEAAAMATTELDRFLSLLEGLSVGDWTKPTACSLWDVRQVVAHVTGAAASYANWAELVRQWSPRVHGAHRRPGFSLLDTLNQIQVDDRADATPQDLLAELRTVGPRAIANRRRLPSAVRAIRLPMPALGIARIGYLTDLIYTRDMWIHRLDIARATAREMEIDARHDGRIISLMVYDLSKRLHQNLGSHAVLLDLLGRAGGVYRIGSGERPLATISLDALDFAWLAAGRMTPADVGELATTSGDPELVTRVIENISVPV